MSDDTPNQTPKVQTIPTSYAIAAQQVAEAQASLFENTDEFPPWPWPNLTALCGKPLPGDLTVIGARPGNGKTTFMLNVFDSLVEAGFQTLYVGAGSEGPPKDLRRQWAAFRCGYATHLVMENRWAELPAGAQDVLYAELQAQALNEHSVAHFANAGERLTPEALTTALRDFRSNAQQGRYVLLDHIHRIRFGTDKNPRLELAEATRWLRDMAAKYCWSIIVAAQLHRASNQHGAVRDLLPPTMSDLKETGTLEEDAVVGLLLYRVKKPNIDNAEIQAVNRGDRELSEILEPNCMAVRVGKHRRRGHILDRTSFLHLHESGRLEDRPPVWRPELALPSQPEKRYGL